MFKVNIKDNRRHHTLKAPYFTSYSSVAIVNFGQENTGWDNSEGISVNPF